MKKLILGFVFSIIVIVTVVVYFDIIYVKNKVKSTTVLVQNEYEGLKVQNMVIQYVVEDTIWASRGYDVYKSIDNGNNYKRKFRVPVSIIDKSYLGNSNYLRNRYRLYDLIELKITKSDAIVIFAGGKIYRTDNNGKSFKVVHILRYFGMNEGRGVMPQGIAQDSDGNLYYGEYSGNRDRNDVKIYVSRDDGLTWEQYYIFPAGSIRHIHSVQYDNYTSNIWVTTGDSDNECIIGYFKNGTDSLKVLFQGDQKFRAVSLLFSTEYIYWGMDSPHLQNYIYRYDRQEKMLEKLNAVDGPVYYSYKMSDGTMVVGTTVEGGRGEVDNYVSIWVTKNGNDWSRRIKTEGISEGRGHAYVRFPIGKNIDSLVFNYINTTEYNNSIIVTQ